MDKLVHTFSIVAYDPPNNEWGVAVQSKFLAAAAVVSWARSNAGAVATQSYANVSYGYRGLDLMEEGYTAEDTIQLLIKNDENMEQRQVGVVDKAGNAASFTGEKCNEWAGHIVGESYACQGNILIPGTVEAMAERFEKAAMLDDGEHNDGVAEDHVYGVSIDIGAGDIQYYIYAQNEEAGIFSPARAEYEYYTIDVTAPVANMLVINEFMASNDTTIFDQNGEYDDWLEIYNKSDSVVNIGGYFLTDDPAALTQWVFPDTSIASHGHLLVWADDNTEQNGLHAGFKLSASGEAILLVDSNEVIVDEIVFSQQSADLSYGRYPDGTDYLTFFAIPTPGEDNVGYRCGDADGNIQIDILDVTYMIDYLYRNGPSPIMIKSSDANDSGNINLLDIIYLINYLYKGGPTPVC